MTSAASEMEIYSQRYETVLAFSTNPGILLLNFNSALLHTFGADAMVQSPSRKSSPAEARLPATSRKQREKPPPTHGTEYESPGSQNSSMSVL